VDDPYEAPEQAECVLDASLQKPPTALAALMGVLRQLGAVTDKPVVNAARKEA
jgi:sulfate adenylyltransferase